MNSYQIKIYAKILQYMVQNENMALDESHQSFIENCLDQVTNQIHISDQKLVLFNEEIPNQFKMDLIIDLVLLSHIDEKIISLFSNLIFSQKTQNFYLFNKDKIQLLITKISEHGFINPILIPIFTNTFLFSILSIDTFSTLLEHLPNELFIQLFPQIEQLFIKAPTLNIHFIQILLPKCNELHLKINSIERIFYFVSNNDINSQILDYLNEYDFLLPEDIAENFVEFPDQNFLFKIIPKFDILPQNLQNISLMEMEDVNFYNRMIQTSEITSPIFTTSEFYIHLYSIISKENDKYSPIFIKSLSNICQKENCDENFIDIIDKMTFSNYPPNDQQIEFLTSFINYFDLIHLKLFSSENHMKFLINEIIKRKDIPFCTFMEIIDSCTILDIIKKQNLLNKRNIQIYYYIFKFSKKNENYGKNFMNLLVSKHINDDCNYLIDFINNNDYHILTKLDEESLLIAISALIYGEYYNIANINGLTKETILPFYAIALKNWKKNLWLESQLFPTKEIENLFLQTFKDMNANNSSLVIASINSILSTEVENGFLAKVLNLSIQMMDIVAENLMKNQYCANKTILFSYIICNSKLFKGMKTNLCDLFRFMVHHLNETNYKSIQHQINFNFIRNAKDIMTSISKDTKDPELPESVLYNYSYFLQHLCCNIPKYAPIEMCHQQGVSSTKSSSIEREVNEILQPILSANDLERSDYLLAKLFERIMKNKILAIGYLKIKFNQIDDGSEDIDDKLLEFYLSYYHKYNSFSSEKSIYSFFDPQSIEFIGSDFEIALIESLFKSQRNCQVFLCLKNIACTFPFLFDYYYETLFDFSIPELDNFYLLFEEDLDKEKEEKVKTALAAFSFLISALHSTTVIGEFSIRFFNDVDKYSCSAIYCFSFILLSILKEKKISMIMIAYMLKYNFFNHLIELMKRKIPQSTFSKNYFHMINLLLIEYFNSLTRMHDCSLIYEVKKIRNSFKTQFNNAPTFIPYTISQIQKDIFLNVPQEDINQNLLIYMHNINEMRTFWINYKIEIKKHHNVYNPSYNTFRRGYLFNLNRKKRDNSSDDNNSNEGLRFFPVHNDQIELIKILNISAFQLLEQDSNFQELCKIIQIICQYDEHILQYFISLCEEDFNSIKEKEKLGIDFLNLFNNIITLLSNVRNCNGFNKYFSNEFLLKLISTILEPQNRTNEELLWKISDIFGSLDKLPVKATHVIGFMFLTKKKDFIQKVFGLFPKFSMNELDHMSTISNIYLHEIFKGDQPINLISDYFDFIPSLPMSIYHIELINLLDRTLNQFSENENNNSVIKLIIKLLDMLTPQRSSQESIIKNESNNQSNYTQAIPQFIYESDPIFWDIFEKHKKLILEIFQTNEQYVFVQDHYISTFLNEYPEFFSFNLRYKIFKQKMKDILNPDYYLPLDIDPENILVSSYNELAQYDLDTIKTDFRINYYNQIGSDEGGLRRDWFINLSKEIFNPDYGLFKESDEMTYLPNSLSGVNPDHNNYFKFAGKIFACALIQEQNVEPHLARSFLRQILGQKIELSDLKDINEQMYESLKFIEENDIDGIGVNFEINYKNEFGILQTYELKENGRNIELGNENKFEYIKLMLEYQLRESIKEQINSFLDGFYSIIPIGTIKMLSPYELDLIFCGIQVIDVKDMQENTIFREYNKGSKPVVLFFEVISKWSQEKLRELINFITGSSRVPINGFKAYKDKGIPITIQPGGGREKCPCAHTCFNILDLPEYETEEELDQKFSISIKEHLFHLV